METWPPRLGARIETRVQRLAAASLLAAAPGDVVLVCFVAWVGEHFGGIFVLDKFSQIAEGRFISDKCCLFNVMGYDNNGLFLLEFIDKILNQQCLDVIH